MIKTLFAVLLLALGAAATFSITPSSYDFGKMVVHSTATKMFQLSSTTPVASLSVPTVTIIGNHPGDFVVDSGFVSNPAGVNNPAAQASQSLPTVRASSCLAGYQAPGSCGYQVRFHPLAIGMRTAQLVVTENGQTARATLIGEGIFGCRPKWVPCNYADHFSGQFVLHSKDVAPQGSTASYRSGQWETNITITVTKGDAFCQGSQDDVELEFVNGKLKSSGTSKGPILGPGLFAIEIRGSGKALEYSISASCPTAHLTVTSTDYIENSVTGQVDVNSATSTVPAQPANWKDKFFTDPLPEVDPFSRVISLIGTQSDPHDSNAASGDNVSGVGTMTWNLKRW
jgi:hypothetical protein